MELILYIIIGILCIVIWIYNIFYNAEKSNANYWKKEYDNVLDENYKLMREVINK